MGENVHEGHRERMRDRYAEDGMDRLYDHEALEMLLYYVVRRGDTNETAHALLNEFQSLHGVMDAPLDALCRVKGVGKSTAFFLRFIGDFNQRVELSRVKNLSLYRLENRFRYFRAMLAGRQDELILAACLDDKMHVVRCLRVAQGIPDRVHVEMQSMVRAVLSTHTSRVILAHNHPMGRAVPSEEDIQTTQQIADALQKLSIEVMDHIIIAGEDACSMEQDGIFAMRIR